MSNFCGSFRGQQLLKRTSTSATSSNAHEFTGNEVAESGLWNETGDGLRPEEGTEGPCSCSTDGHSIERQSDVASLQSGGGGEGGSRQRRTRSRRWMRCRSLLRTSFLLLRWRSEGERKQEVITLFIFIGRKVSGRHEAPPTHHKVLIGVGVFMRMELASLLT